MQPRPLDPEKDMPAVAEFLGKTRASGGLSHPGGIQWWLRELGQPGFEAFVVDGNDGLAGFALIDESQFCVLEPSDGSRVAIELIEWTADHLRDGGRPTFSLHVARDSELHRAPTAREFTEVGTELELMFDIEGEPAREALPAGYRFGSLSDVGDDGFIEMHRAAWSDKRPSPYRRALHDAVKRMPQFRPDLVTVALTPDGRGAAYCIGWYDEISRTLEIEPLGTHRDFRRQGLALAVVREVIHRAYENGARHVLVWNDPNTNLPAYGLYTSAGMTPHRHLVELEKTL
jgi:GNAT superfamily N-acetyltransferase